MEVVICESKEELGKRAGYDGARLIKEAIKEKGQASIILATGTSQFDVLSQIIKSADIDWSKVIGFHLDEYIGLDIDHPASFRKYLKERFVQYVPIKEFHYINGEGDYNYECARLGEIIKKYEIDVAFVGIGENGHLAFNDPPADFETENPYIVVELDEISRRQQLKEGWFKDLNEVPKKAISMSIRQIMKSRNIICSVPEARKAKAVRACIEGPVTPYVPSSILQTHKNATIYLDPDSASLLKRS